jgi:hypothetical protein
MNEEELRAALDAIEAHWNSAEEYVKKVERLRRGLVVGASINELRYAGRRLVEAYALSKDVAADPSKAREALALLGEVKHFCMRAKHDAMDAAVTYIDQALAKFESEFGADLLNEKFPQYIQMKGLLREVSEVMAQSRGDRAVRDALYLNIRDDLVPSLIDHHYDLETSRIVLVAAYTKRIRGERRENIRFWITIAIGAGTLVAALFAVPAVSDYFKNQKAASDTSSIAATSSAPKQPARS